MEIPDARSLSPEAQQALRERVVAALVDEGLSITEAAAIFGVHRCTASGWYNAYRRPGDDALAAQARGRKPAPLLTPTQEQALLDILTQKTPTRLGWRRRSGPARRSATGPPANWGCDAPAGSGAAG